jgi:putative hydrolase of the HAD superfamily
MKLHAITFDFWNTLYWGRGTSFSAAREERVDAIREALLAEGVSPPADELEAAYVSGFKAYEDARARGLHFGARDHVLHVFGLFGAGDTDSVVDRAALRIEEAGSLAPLTLLPGAAEAIPALHRAGVGLGLISDTGTTPGRVLLKFLKRDGLLDCFRSLTFSDETGVVKPNPLMFLRTLEQLGAAAAESAHVGDLPRSDVAGAQAVGMEAIRFAAADDRHEPPEADLVIFDHRELLPLV